MKYRNTTYAVQYKNKLCLFVYIIMFFFSTLVLIVNWSLNGELLVVLVRLSIPVEVIDWKDSSPIIMFFFSTLVLIVSNFIVACAFVTCY